MKKYIFAFLLFIFNCLFLFSQNWEKIPLGDGFTAYYQQQIGEDLETNYFCLISFEMSEDIFGFTIAPIPTDFLNKNLKLGNFSIKFRKGNTEKSFDGIAKKSKNESFNLETSFFVLNKNESIRIYNLLKKGGTWEILCEGEGWYLRTKVNADNLPVFDIEKIEARQ